MALLFVYGTLLHQVDSRMANFLKANARKLGSGYVFGQLYEVDGYPALVKSSDGSDKVVGNIFELNNSVKVFEELDKYEEVGEAFEQPNEYVREETEVFFDDGRKVTSWVYLYNHSVDNLTRIESGDFWAYINKTN